MLKDRITLNGNRFYVVRESGEQREVYYSVFDLRNAPGEKKEMCPIKYWDGANAYEVILDMSECCVLVEEKAEGKTVESHRFFYSKWDRKGELNISVTKAKRAYGANAYAITIEWVDCNAEPINTQYIYLSNKKGEKYYFLRDTIEPLNPNGKKLYDQYIFRLPEGESRNDYFIEVDPLVEEKYCVELD